MSGLGPSIYDSQGVLDIGLIGPNGFHFAPLGTKPESISTPTTVLLPAKFNTAERPSTIFCNMTQQNYPRGLWMMLVSQ